MREEERAGSCAGGCAAAGSVVAGSTTRSLRGCSGATMRWWWCEAGAKASALRRLPFVRVRVCASESFAVEEREEARTSFAEDQRSAASDAKLRAGLREAQRGAVLDCSMTTGEPLRDTSLQHAFLSRRYEAIRSCFLFLASLPSMYILLSTCCDLYRATSGWKDSAVDLRGDPCRAYRSLSSCPAKPSLAGHSTTILNMHTHLY